MYVECTNPTPGFYSLLGDTLNLISSLHMTFAIEWTQSLQTRKEIRFQLSN